MYRLKNIGKEGEKEMAYVLRERTKEDVEFFLENGVTSPWGGMPGFDYSLVECLEDNIKMIFIGGQGIMNEYGIEWSEMAHYALVICERNIFTIEFFSCKKFTDRTPKKLKYENIYKIKAIKSSSSYDKQMILNIVKQCFIAYGNGGKASSVCEKVSFIDEEVRWM